MRTAVLVISVLFTYFGFNAALETLPGPRFSTAKTSVTMDASVKVQAKGKGCPWPGCGVKDPDKYIDKGWQAVAVLAQPGGAAGGGVPEGGYMGSPGGE